MPNRSRVKPFGAFARIRNASTCGSCRNPNFGIGPDIFCNISATGWQQTIVTAAEAGNTHAAINYVGSLRSGMGNLRRDPELTARWAKFLLTHPEYSPVPGR